MGIKALEKLKKNVIVFHILHQVSVVTVVSVEIAVNFEPEIEILPDDQDDHEKRKEACAEDAEGSVEG